MYNRGQDGSPDRVRDMTQRPENDTDRMNLAALADMAGTAWAKVRDGLRRGARAARARPYLAWLIATSAVCIVLMIFVDAPLAQNLKIGMAPAATDFFSTYGGAAGKPEAYLLVAAVIIAVCHAVAYFNVLAETKARLKRYQDAALFFIVAVLAGGIVVNIVKPIIGRIRPRGLFQDGTYGFHMFSTDWGMNSFPSGHTQMAFSMAIALTLIYPRYDVLYFLIAAALGASRFLGSVHYLSDVVMGAYVGIVVPLLVKKYFYDPRGINMRIYFDRDHTLPRPRETSPADPSTSDKTPEDGRGN